MEGGMSGCEGSKEGGQGGGADERAGVLNDEGEGSEGLKRKE